MDLTSSIFASFLEEFTETQLFQNLLDLFDRKTKGEQPTTQAEEEVFDLLTLVEKCLAIKSEEMQKGEEGSEERWIQRIREMLSPATWTLETIPTPPPPSSEIEDEG